MRTDGRTNGQTDLEKLIVAFHSFANAHKRTEKIRYFSPPRIFPGGNESELR
jgi:hypothetical protein